MGGTPLFRLCGHDTDNISAPSFDCHTASETLLGLEPHTHTTCRPQSHRVAARVAEAVQAAFFFFLSASCMHYTDKPRSAHTRLCICPTMLTLSVTGRQRRRQAVHLSVQKMHEMMSLKEALLALLAFWGGLSPSDDSTKNLCAHTRKPKLRP